MLEFRRGDHYVLLGCGGVARGEVGEESITAHKSAQPVDLSLGREQLQVLLPLVLVQQA